MTVAELIEKLKTFPQELEVIVATQFDDATPQWVEEIDIPETQFQRRIHYVQIMG